MNIELKRAFILYEGYQNEIYQISKDYNYEIDESFVYEEGIRPIIDDNEMIIDNENTNIDSVLKTNLEFKCETWDDYCIKLLSRIIERMEEALDEFYEYKNEYDAQNLNRY